MPKEQPAENPTTIIPMLRSDVVGTILLGAATGIIIFGLSLVFNRFIFDTYLCPGEVSAGCMTAKNYSVGVASFIGIIAALGGLMRLRVYRPLLVAIASIVSLWGVVQIVWDFYWVFSVLAVALLYALAFGVYSWVARIREFWISLLIVIVLVAAVRLALLG